MLNAIDTTWWDRESPSKENKWAVARPNNVESGVVNTVKLSKHGRRAGGTQLTFFLSLPVFPFCNTTTMNSIRQTQALNKRELENAV